MDILDLLSIKDTLFLSGTYRRLKSHSGEYFEYEIIDEPSRSYGKVINNLIADNSNIVIKTNYDCDFKIKGYIVTQDDTMYQITRVQKLMQSVNKDVLAVVKHNPATEYLIAMLEVDNPWSVK